MHDRIPDTPDRRPLAEAVIDNAPFGAHMYELDSGGRLVFIGYNRKAEEMLGIDHSALIGMTLEQAFPGNAGTETAEAYHRVARDGGTWDTDQYSYSEADIAGVFEVHAFSFGPNRVSVFFRDITEKRMLELALEETEGRLVRATAEAPFPIMIHAEDGEVMEINRAWTEITGYSLADIPTIREWTEKAYGERSGLVREAIERLYDLTQPEDQGEYVIRTATGEQRVWDFRSAPLGTAPDGRRLVISTASDVTARNQAVEGLRVSEDRFRYIFSQSVVAKSITNPDGQLDVNDAFCEMFGYTREELAARVTWDQLTHPDDIPDSQSEFDALLAGERDSARFEKRYVRKNGDVLWADVSTSLRRDDEGRPLYFLTTILDMTERKRDALELERRAARLKQLLAERDRHLELLSTTLNSVVGVMGRVVETRDPYTAGHQRRVAELAVGISEEMGLPEHEVEEIRVAALIHDVGKVSVPAEILSKPGKLSPVEFELVKCHSEAGYQIIASANMEGLIAEIVYQHHERCDGTGYPRGLRGAELLAGAKIIMVADVVEAMSSHRPYREALGIARALEEIERGTGRQYDAEVSRACMKVIGAGFTFPEA